MTPKERAAMKQALKALENAPIEYDFHGNPMDVEFGQQLYKAITALREALAEQAEQEPIKFPNLRPVINWLENGCDPKEAAKVLRIYQERLK